jgi:hypothetical protein
VEVNWAARYEALRAHALGQAPVTFIPLGLGVLYSRGVAAWLRCEVMALSGRAPPPAGERSESSYETDLPVVQAELVQLLAGTALLTVTRRSV